MSPHTSLLPLLLISIALLLSRASPHLLVDLASTDWSLYNANRSISTSGSVPGSSYSILEDKCRISDILFGSNDVNTRWVAREDWTFFRQFTLNRSQLSYTSIQLVLHGVDTVANISVNNKQVVTTDNMFRRYNVEIKPILEEGTNNITVTFESPVKAAEELAGRSRYEVPPVCHPPEYNGECNINFLRKTQASFAWDWGPAFPTVGIWKPIELVLSEGPVIRTVGVVTAPEGDYWRVNLSVWFDPSKMKVKDTLYAELSHPQSGVILVAQEKLDLKGTTQDPVPLTFVIAQSKIKPWWPSGYGEQNLYGLRVYYTHSEKSIEIGFRTVEIIQEDVSSNPSDGKSFYFRVNGVKVFAKGSNWIPSHVLPERLSDPALILPLLEAAAAAHFNMMRVWGGGVYESDLFYQTCDRLGIMIWQDLMFACSMYPTSSDFLATVSQEVKEQVQRLMHHPSVAVWAGNNENEVALRGNWYGTAKNFELYKSDFIKLYIDTIKPIVEKTDPSRKYLSSSPSNGVKTEEEGYVAQNPYDPAYGDIHYYNYLSNNWDYRIYPKPRFASEYGFQSYPTYTCLLKALPLAEMRWTADSIAHRQHAVGGNAYIQAQTKLNLPWSNNMKDITYLSQITQAMSVKTESERYRRLKSTLLDSGEGYTAGALYWQLNDIWQAPSWSSIDYCGNWKMLHYYVIDFFAPVIVSPELSEIGDALTVYVVVDGPTVYSEAELTLTVHSWNSSNWQPTAKHISSVQLIENESFMALKVPLTEDYTGCRRNEDCFFTTSLAADGKAIAPQNFLFPAGLISRYPATTVKITNFKIIDSQTAEISLTTERYALFVWLDLNGLKGVFSKNGFHMFQPTDSVIFTSKEPIDESIKNIITLTWLQQEYL